ncbi:MAG: ribonuclease HII [Bacteroidales bacterium]|nr:ribonuclease HII [Bacteroidales bacterium]
MHGRLKISWSDKGLIEAGVDEAGRGCLAGPVFAAAVILPYNPSDDLLQYMNDSKMLSHNRRTILRKQIEEESVAWSVAMADNQEIDKINILNASYLAMHRAIEKLDIRPELLLVDGNRFRPFESIHHQCIIKGDGLYYSIAAASILAKTWRDEFMLEKHEEFPQYYWNKNKGYPTIEHRKAIFEHGASPLHRKSFKMGIQMKIGF